MMKKTLKTLVAVLACMCSFTFAACGKQPSGDSTPDNSQESSSFVEEYFLLKDTSLSMIVGDEYALEVDYYVEQDGEVSFRSSNTAVAQVDNGGKITAIGEGETTITAELGSFSATCAVTVSFGEYVPTILFTAIQGAEVTVANTDVLDLSACIFFNGKQFPCELSYELSDAEIGQVENGIFTPLQVGETEVTVGGEWNGMELLPVTISVKVINAVEIEIKEKGGEYGVNGIELYTYHQFGGQSLQVAFEVEVSVLKNGTPQTEGVTVSVEDNDGVVSFDDVANVVTALKPGEANLKVSFTDGVKVYEKSIAIQVRRPVGQYAATVIVDSYKGELPVDEIFAEFPESDREIIAVSEGFTLENGKVFGFTVDNEKTQEVTVYNNAVGYTLTVVGDNKIVGSKLTITNGAIALDNVVAEKAIFELGNEFGDQSTALTLDNVTLTGDSYSSANGVFYINLGSTLNVMNSTVVLKNEKSATGSVFAAETVGNVTIGDSVMMLENTVAVANRIDVIISNSEVVVTATVENGLGYAFNGGALTVNGPLGQVF